MLRRSVVVVGLGLAVACGSGGGNNTPPGGTSSIPAAVSGPLSSNLANTAASVAGQSQQAAVTAQAVALAIQAGVQVAPVSMTAAEVAVPSRPQAALTSGAAEAFGFQVQVQNLAGSSGTITVSGVLVYQDAADWVLVGGVSPTSPIPPGIGILTAGGQVWLASAGTESAQLQAEGAVCPLASALPAAVTACNLASFTNAGFSVTTSTPFTSGASGSETASLAVGNLAGGVSLVINCAIGSLCPSNSAAIVVSVSPPTASVSAGGTQQFYATVTGSSNSAVSWSVLEGPSGGTVDNSGLYTAPSTAGTYHVKATSQADISVFGEATVTVTGSGQGFVAYWTGPVSSTPAQLFPSSVTFSINGAANNVLNIGFPCAAGYFIQATQTSATAFTIENSTCPFANSACPAANITIAGGSGTLSGNMLTMPFAGQGTGIVGSACTTVTSFSGTFGPGNTVP